MKKIIVIPARLASSRLPNKPLAKIGSKTMIEWMLHQAQKASCDQAVVACCGEEIKTLVEQAGGTAVITDPHLPSGTDRVYAAVKALQLDHPESIIINLQGDLPFINPIYLSKAAALLENSSQFDISTLAAPITQKEEITNPATVKVAFSPNTQDPTYGHAHYFSRAPIPCNAPTYYHHIGLYAFRFEALDCFVKAAPTYLEQTEKLEQLRALDLNLKIGVGIVEDEPPISIDTPQDLEAARAHEKTL